MGGQGHCNSFIRGRGMSGADSQAAGSVGSRPRCRFATRLAFREHRPEGEPLSHKSIRTQTAARREAWNLSGGPRT